MTKIQMKKWAVILAILLFPSILYVLYSGGKHGFHRLPVLGPKTAVNNETATADTLYHKVSFSGKLQSLYLSDSVYRVFSILSPVRDPLNDRIINQLLFNHKKFDKRTDLVFISLTWPTDSANLQEVPEINARDSRRWNILEVPYEELIEFVTTQLLLPHPDTASEIAFRGQMVILDKQMRVRSCIDATQYTEGKKLTDDLKVLKAEEFVKFKKTK
jgi:hypothetical protein